MAGTVSIDEANDRQLRVLLGLGADEIRELKALRPIASKAAIEQRLKHPVLNLDPALNIAKRDLNEAGSREIEEAADITHEVAERIVAQRPYFVALQLRSVQGVDPDAFSRVTDLYAPQRLAYVDKLSGRSVELTPDTSRLLVTLKESDGESASQFAWRHRGRRAEGAASGRYHIIQTAQSEGGIDAITEFRNDQLVQSVVPAFRRPRSSPLFIDPDLLVVQFDQTIQEARQEAIIDALGLEIIARHRTVGLYTLKLREGHRNPTSVMDAITALNSSPEVDFAEPAYIGVDDLERAAPTDSGGGTVKDSSPWNLALVGVDINAGASAGAADIVLAVVDTGADLTHPAISRALLERPRDNSWNFEDDSNPDPVDDVGHGTFIAGLLAGSGVNGIWGICPSAKILPLRVPLAGTSLSYARRRDAILYAVNFVRPPRRLLINLSWKTTGDIALIRDAISQAVRSGALVVASAGNWPESQGDPHFPSDYPEVISVGAVGPNARRAAYSYYGPEIDLVAPGGSGSPIADENLLSAAPGGGNGVDFGTSFSSPHVAGAAAILLSRNPTLSVSQLRAALEQGALRIADDGTGRGLISLSASLEALDPGSYSAEPVGNDAVDGLEAVNSMDIATMSRVFGVFTITARIIVSRRPILALVDLKGVLGLSDLQYDCIASYQSENLPPVISGD